MPQSPDSLEWFDQQVSSTYRKGAETGRELLRESGVNPVDHPGVSRSPIHQSARQTLYAKQREYWGQLAREVENDVRDEVRATLRQGGSLREALSAASDRVDKVGVHRARQIAETETARAFNWGMVSEYEHAGVEDVRVEVEWVTAGDTRVCMDCAGMSGTYSMEEAKSMLKSGTFPHHPRCRCLLLPAGNS